MIFLKKTDLKTCLTKLAAIGWLTAYLLVLTSCSEQVTPTVSPSHKKTLEKELPLTDWAVFRGNSQLTGRGEIENLSFSGAIKLLWTATPQMQKGGSEGFSTTPVIKDEILYVVGSEGSIYAISCKDGKVKWQTQIDTSFEASAAIYGNTLFCGSVDGDMFAFDKRDGKQNWKFETEGRIVGAANYIETDKGTYLIFGSYDYNVYCLDATIGKKIWSFESDNYVNGTPAISGEKVVFGGCDEQLRFLDISNGKELFSVDSGSYIPGSPVICDGRSFVSLYDGNLICVGIEGKSIQWRFAGDNEKDTFRSSPATDGERVYVTSRGNMVYAVNSHDGKKTWEYRATAPFDASPVILGNILISAATDGVISMIEKESGKLLGKYETGETFSGSPALSGSKIFIASEEGTVYAFQACH